MAQLERLLARHQDIPLLESKRVPAGTAGTANDYEQTLLAIPDLTQLTGALKGVLPSNYIAIRSVILTPEANLTGSSSHSFLWAVRQWRAGAALNIINTTSATTISASSMAVTPASMAGIQVGTLLYISGGTGSAETVQVTAISGGTFTATFANSHSGAYTITSTYLVAVDYNGSGVTETAYTPHQLQPAIVQPVKGGDILTFQRLSSDSTGLASPAVTVTLEYVGIQNNTYLG